MKNIISIAIILLLGSMINAQIAIEKNTIDGDGILDFKAEDSNTKKGLILPQIETLASNSAPGTIYLNRVSGKVEYLDKDLTVVPMSKSANSNGLTPLINPENEEGRGVVISDGTLPTSSNRPGILVLDSAAKAIILPKVTQPELAIKSPAPGMMVYDISSNSIAIYNGENWSYWN